ncbi:MAG TPA: nitrile hydratase subunit beta [Gammaproteobacteria bacterium]|nr:nitrile hydratase subunit beta [Gammaproteobacteria bacterium]
MNGIHDLAGMENLGPIDIEKDEPVFHEDWERHIFAITMATMGSGYFKTDEVRRETELMPPADYLRARYYEKWLFSFENLMLEKDVLTLEELESGKSLREEGGFKLPPVPLEGMQYAMHNPVPASLDVDVPQNFQVGDHILAKNINPPYHTRLPRYIRGKHGVIVQHHGVFLLPDTNAYGGPDKPQHCYNVKFSFNELWGDETSHNDFIYIDLFDEYMLPDE